MRVSFVPVLRLPPRSSTRRVSLPGEKKDKISPLHVKNVTERYPNGPRDPLVLFSIHPGAGRGMERGGKGEINTREGKKRAMPAEGRDGFGAARDGADGKRCGAPLADPPPPQKPFPGESPEARAWLGAPPRERLAPTLLRASATNLKGGKSSVKNPASLRLPPHPPLKPGQIPM